jgi:predicted ATPase/DNA-binding winged helix-turn-helix (wHTH) protein
MGVEGVGLIYASNGCSIDLMERELRVHGTVIPLGGRAFEFLEVLVRSAGQVVTKDELMSRIWPGAFVMENTLQVHAGAIRKALGPYRGVLKTESRRGYRLLGDWTIRSENSSRSLSPRATRQSGEAARTNIPAATASLVGRSAATRRLKDLLSAYRVVTLVGVGGIGKTSLALQLGRDLLPEFPDGCWMVELGPLSDPSLVTSAVAAPLSLTLVGARISSSNLAGAIGRRRLLLILDNCEHVINVVANLVEALVSLCPQITILATSREALRVSGEHVYRVLPLEVPTTEPSREILGHSAVELFVLRANAFDADYAPSFEELPIIADICRRLDGIPLAIEFAAARQAALGTRGLADGLDNRFSLFGTGRRTALPRHQTLRAAFDWSFDLLTKEERQLLCYLSIFRGSFSLDGAVAVGGDEFAEVTVINGIASLFDKSLVILDAFEAGSRWRLLETTRMYALDKLRQDSGVDEVARRHASYLHDLIISAVPAFTSSLPTEELIRYGREVDNIRSALDWSFSPSGDSSIGIDLTAAYAPFWMQFSLISECHQRCKHALDLVDAGATLAVPLQMLLLLYLGVAVVHTSGQSAQPKAILRRALGVADSLGDLGAQAIALFFLHGVYWYRGEYAEMTSATERLEQIAPYISDPFIVNAIDRHAADTLATAGKLKEARQKLERVVQFIRVDGRRVPFWRRPLADHVKARAMLARCLWLQGFPESAMSEAYASLDEAPAADQVATCLVLYFGICWIAPMTGDFVAAEKAINRFGDVATRMDSRLWSMVAQFFKGKLLVERGDFFEGSEVLRFAFEASSESGWRPSYPEFRGSLALALRSLGRLDEAEIVISEALAAASQSQDARHWYLPELLRSKAEILALQSPGGTARAESVLLEGLEIARDQGARAWELRIVLTLARLRAARGHRDHARQMLIPLYGAFTEGFDTADLREAKELLSSG